MILIAKFKIKIEREETNHLKLRHRFVFKYDKIISSSHMNHQNFVAKPNFCAM